MNYVQAVSEQRTGHVADCSSAKFDQSDSAQKHQISVLALLMSADTLQALNFTSPPEPVYKAQRDYSGEQTNRPRSLSAACKCAPPRLPSSMHACVQARIRATCGAHYMAL